LSKHLKMKDNKKDTSIVSALCDGFSRLKLNESNKIQIDWLKQLLKEAGSDQVWTVETITTQIIAKLNSLGGSGISRTHCY